MIQNNSPPRHGVFASILSFLRKLKFLYFQARDLFTMGVLFSFHIGAIWLVLGTLASFHFQSQMTDKTSEEDLFRTIEIISERKSLEEQVRLYQNQIDDIQDSINTTYEESAIDEIADPVQRESAHRRFPAQISGLRTQKENIQNSIREFEGRIGALHSKETALNGNNVKSMRGLASDFLYLEKLHFKILVLMPGHLLTLIITISMGALGSVIHATWEFFESSEDRDLRWYVFRPLLGATLALAMFILLKSGQMIITNSSGIDGNGDDLNPFFVSLLAIVSGILSKEAYERISEAGTKLLRPPSQADETQRWIRQEVAVAGLNASKRKVEELDELLDVSLTRVQNWLAGDEPLSSRYQEIVAAWLGVSPRELFTDMPPSE